MLHNIFLTEILPTLPFNWQVHSLYIGRIWTIAICEDPWGERCAGLVASPTEDELISQHEFDFGHNLIHCQTPIQLANLLATSDPVCNTVGLAILKALLVPMVESLPSLDAHEWLLEACWEKKTAIVGQLPLQSHLQGVAQTLHILNEAPQQNEHHLHEAPCLLPQADVVAISSTALVQGRLDELLFWIRSSAKVMLFGSSTPLVPSLLSRGIDIVASTIVTDIPQAYEAVVLGKSYQTVPGVRSAALENELETLPQQLWQPQLV